MGGDPCTSWSAASSMLHSSAKAGMLHSSCQRNCGRSADRLQVSAANTTLQGHLEAGRLQQCRCSRPSWASTSANGSLPRPRPGRSASIPGRCVWWRGRCALLHGPLPWPTAAVSAQPISGGLMQKHSLDARAALQFRFAPRITSASTNRGVSNSGKRQKRRRCISHADGRLARCRACCR